MKSKVTTKKGDEGYTCLWSKEIISKADIKVECLGQIDQLIAWIGILYTKIEVITTVHDDLIYVDIPKYNKDLEKIQDILSKICAELMSTNSKSKLKYNDGVRFLDSKCKFIENTVILPDHWWFQSNGGNNASYFNYARVLTRNCERQIVKVLNETKLDNVNLIKFFNRLSDYFYLLTLYVDGRVKK